MAACNIKQIWLVGFAEPSKSLPLNTVGCLSLQILQTANFTLFCLFQVLACKLNLEMNFLS